MSNCVVSTFFVIAQIIEGGRRRRRVSGGRLALAGSHAGKVTGGCSQTASPKDALDYGSPLVQVDVLNYTGVYEFCPRGLLSSFRPQYVICLPGDNTG
jgi:hypothetical protein